MNTPLCTGGPISYRSKFCLQILKTKTPGQQIARTLIRLTIMFGVNVGEVRSLESSAKGHPGTEASACEDLGRVITRRNLQVDH